MTDKQKLKIAAAVAAALALAWLLFYPSERDRLDAEAKRLCAIDGGVKVYETVTLPADKFHSNGVPKISSKDAQGFGYFSKASQEHIAGQLSMLAGDGAGLKKHTYQVIRSSDGKVMGEERIYSRHGGCFWDGVVHGCGYSCPVGKAWSMENQIFKKEGAK